MNDCRGIEGIYPVNSTASSQIIFIHGLMGSNQGTKARHLMEIFPGIVCPDFAGTLNERIQKLEQIMSSRGGWKVIGSSLGGLMGAIYTCANPERVEKLVLLAPALTWPDFSSDLPGPVSVPAVIYHGKFDSIIPLDEMRIIAKKLFTNLTVNVVDDDHSLHKTIAAIDWRNLLEIA
ncbi:MAG: alpha/beta fold hydrolase [Anaerolineales bacterium]